MSQNDLEKLVREVIRDMAVTVPKPNTAVPTTSRATGTTEINLNVPDISAVKLEETIFVESPKTTMLIWR